MKTVNVAAAWERVQPRLLARWREARALGKVLRAEYNKNEERIEVLYMDYQMMVAGRALRARIIDEGIRNCRKALAENFKAKNHELLPVLTIQMQLIETLVYATTRGKRNKLAPAEFKDVVEGRRRQVLTRLA